jgi:Na+/H+ antiporter NhaD/arsenite permease-like protein
MSGKHYTKTKRLTLVATILASSLVFIDGTALITALPAIQKDLNLNGPLLLWVVNAYSPFLSALLCNEGLFCPE